jgi:xanthine dehydrogenase iron-sulfur cluster and FAD-binding subunit A
VEDLVRGQQLEAALVARAVAALPHEIAPIDDIRSTAAYRRRVAQNLLQEFLSENE